MSRCDTFSEIYRAFVECDVRAHKIINNLKRSNDKDAMAELNMAFQISLIFYPCGETSLLIISLICFITISF